MGEQASSIENCAAGVKSIRGEQDSPVWNGALRDLNRRHDCVIIAATRLGGFLVIIKFLYDILLSAPTNWGLLSLLLYLTYIYLA